jgi:hypothetical protein
MVISNETERQTQSIAQSSLAVLSSSGSMAIVFLETTTVKGSKEDKPQLDMVFTTRTIPIEDGIQIETFPQTQVTSAGAEPPDWPVATAVSNDQAPTGHQTTDQGPKVPAITLEQASDILPTLHASMNRTPEEVGLPILPPILGIIVASISVAVILTFRALRRNSHV